MNNFDTNIPEADLDPIKDTDGKDDFTEGETYEQKLEIIKGKYDSLEELIQAHKDVSFWDKLKLTVQGKTDVGRVTGTVLNIAELFAPSWAVKARDVIQSQTKPKDMNILKRAFSLQGVKHFFKFRDEDGKFSWEQVGVSLLQVGVLVLLAWLDSQFGLGLLKMIMGK